jgi:hypothetical protein
MQKAQRYYVIACVIFSTFTLCTEVSGCFRLVKRSARSAYQSADHAADRLIDATIP